MAEEANADYGRMDRDNGDSGCLHLDSCSFVRMARQTAVLVCVVMWATPFLPFTRGEATQHTLAFALHILLAVVVSVLELPFCCTFLSICRRMQPCLAPLEVYWLRALFYACVAGAMITVNLVLYEGGDALVWGIASILILVFILYALAALNEWEDQDGLLPQFSGGGESATASASSIAHRAMAAASRPFKRDKCAPCSASTCPPITRSGGNDPEDLERLNTCPLTREDVRREREESSLRAAAVRAAMATV